LKVIFLDIDGVLNSWRFFKDAAAAGERTPPGAAQIDKKSVRWLNRLIQDTNAKVVVSSTWRLIYSLGELQTMLESKNFIGSLIDRTPSLPGMPRGTEIAKWLLEHPEVTNHVAFDDGDDIDGPNFVWVDARKGLKERHIDSAAKILGVP